MFGPIIWSNVCDYSREVFRYLSKIRHGITSAKYVFWMEQALGNPSVRKIVCVCDICSQHDVHILCFSSIKCDTSICYDLINDENWCVSIQFVSRMQIGAWTRYILMNESHFGNEIYHQYQFTGICSIYM